MARRTAPPAVDPETGRLTTPMSTSAAPLFEVHTPDHTLSRLPLRCLREEPGHNPRTDYGERDGTFAALVESIRRDGLLEPIIVRQVPDMIDDWYIVAGHRRAAAAKVAGLVTVPCLWLTGDHNPVALALTENLQRRDLNPLEEAEGYQRLESLGWSQEAIGRTVGRSQSHVSRALSLLGLPEGTRTMLREGLLSASHGAELLRLLGTKHEYNIDNVAGACVEFGRSVGLTRQAVSAYLEMDEQEARRAQTAIPVDDEDEEPPIDADFFSGLWSALISVQARLLAMAPGDSIALKAALEAIGTGGRSRPGNGWYKTEYRGGESPEVRMTYTWPSGRSSKVILSGYKLRNFTLKAVEIYGQDEPARDHATSHKHPKSVGTGSDALTRPADPAPEVKPGYTPADAKAEYEASQAADPDEKTPVQDAIRAARDQAQSAEAEPAGWDLYACLPPRCYEVSEEPHAELLDAGYESDDEDGRVLIDDVAADALEYKALMPRLMDFSEAQIEALRPLAEARKAAGKFSAYGWADYTNWLVDSAIAGRPILAPDADALLARIAAHYSQSPADYLLAMLTARAEALGLVTGKGEVA